MTAPRPGCGSFELRTLCAVVLALAFGSARAQVFQVDLVPRADVQARLHAYGGTNAERGARLKKLFVNAGCGEHVSEQPVRHAREPNVICVLPGTSDRFIIVGAHFDRVPGSRGVADNWSGASLLPSLYTALKVEPRRHTYIFIGFSDEEKGLVGSQWYVHKMTPAQVAATDAMINLDTLGLAPTEVWAHRADKGLTLALYSVAQYLKLPLRSVNFEEVGSTDSQSFRQRKIPVLTVHSLTQRSEDKNILHTGKDNLSVMKLHDYYDSYRLMAVYLGYLDGLLIGPPQPQATATTSKTGP